MAHLHSCPMADTVPGDVAQVGGPMAKYTLFQVEDLNLPLVLEFARDPHENNSAFLNKRKFKNCTTLFQFTFKTTISSTKAPLGTNTRVKTRSAISTACQLPTITTSMSPIVLIYTVFSTKIKKINKKYEVFLQSFAIKHYHQISGNPELHFQK